MKRYQGKQYYIHHEIPAYTGISHDALVIILGIFMKKIRKNLTPYTIFSLLMIVFCSGWFLDMVSHIHVWTYKEIFFEYCNDWSIIIASIICILSYKFKKSYLYKISSLSLCFLALFWGSVWGIYDIIYYDGYSMLSDTTNLIKIFGGSLLLISYNEDHFLI